MKIIVLGETPQNKMPVRKTCGSCKTLFEYEVTDINTDKDGDYVICPNNNCKQFISVNYKEESGPNQR
jgi:hypothetical protein